MAPYLRLPRGSEEIDRLLIGNDVYTVTSHKERAALRTLRLELAVRAAILGASILIIIFMGIEWSRFAYDDAYGMAYAGPWPALVVSLLHILYRPVVARMSMKLDHCRHCSQSIKQFQRRAKAIAQLVDVFVSLFMFPAAVIPLGLARNRSRPLSVSGGLLGLGISIHFTIAPLDEEDDVETARRPRSPDHDGHEANSSGHAAEIDPASVTMKT